MKKTWEKFYKNVLGNKFFNSEDKVLLAVSGGPDSICMLHMMYRLSKKMEIELLVVNFNHNLRKEAKNEAKAVKELSNKLGIECILKELNVKKYSKENNVSIETAGRKLRYANLEEIATKNKCNKIVTAHNANDNAETVLMWLLRGSGTLTGIPQRRKINKKIEIVRPILSIERKDIEKYVKKHNLPFLIDKSNLTDEYTRNKVRHLIIPNLEKLNPMVIQHILSLTTISSREDAYLQEISDTFLKKCTRIFKNRILLDLKRFLQYNEAVRFRILKDVFPNKKYNTQINIVMDKILTMERSPYRLCSDWVFYIKSQKAIFEQK